MPVNVGLLFNRVTLAESRASAIAPARFPAGKLVNPAPLPVKLVAVMVPFTSRAVAGLFLLMPTPPVARMRNWLVPVEAKFASVESPQTNAPV